MSERTTTWVLLVAMALTLLLPYFTFVIAGLSPLVVMLLAFLPLHGVGHNVYAPVNLYRLFQRGLG